MKLNKLLVIAVVFLQTIFAYGQNVEFSKDNFKDQKDGLKKALNEISEGDKYFSEGPSRYKIAIDNYLAAQKFNPNNAVLNYKIGKCLLHTIDKTDAIPYLEKAYKLVPDIAEDVRYLLGKAYHLNMEFDVATTHYKAYKDRLTKNQQEELLIVNRNLNECINGKDLVANPTRVFLDNLGKTVNSKYPDYGPLISADESVLIFTSRRDNTTGLGIDPYIMEYFEDIYISYNNNGKWSTAVNMGKPINTEEHDATVGLSADGQKMLVYKDDKGDGNIYECELKGDNWSKPQKLSKNINSAHHESSACFSPNGKALYFVSNNPDVSIGGRDIFVSYADEKGKWGKSVNLGPTINTKLNEESVFMHPDGKSLYFSSQGHKSMGGYDIFKSVIDEGGKWSTPVNVGYPINTPDDDVFFVLSASGKHGYYSSFRPDGEGEKDIYMITFLGPEKQLVLNTEDNLLASVAEPVRERVIEEAVVVEAAKITLLKGVISDAMTQIPLEADIELIDNDKNIVLANFKSNNKSGKYLLSLPSGKNYGIAVKVQGYLFHSENFNIPAIADYQEITKDIQMKNVAVGSKIVLKNIFFDFGKFTLRPESTNELERLIKLLNDVPTLKIEISGHTDNRGSAEMNQKLSENRAKTVVEYLINKGIPTSRLEFKGYGLTEPVATNETDEGRQENRRTEFKILSK
ncbi:MAG: OmpA family protein [Bacteroidetes bacterium]|nr:OmpA family protein [Bacteroidota bacterium]HET6246037.1 OmpA family protein [Bacteroidia bacterium]